MAQFNTFKASKAWEAHSKDLLAESKLSTAQLRFKTAVDRLDASQAKILNGELLKMSKAMSKALDQLGKQQAKISDKQSQLDELEKYQAELAKEIKDLGKDQKMDAKKREEAVRKNEAQLSATDKKVHALHDSMQILEDGLDERLKDFHTDLSDLEEELTASNKKAATDFGKQLISRMKAEAKEKEKKEIAAARIQAKEIREVLDRQLEEVQSSIKDVTDEAAKKQVTDLQDLMNQTRKALAEKQYGQYVALNRQLQKTRLDNQANQKLNRRLDDIEDVTKQEQDFRREKREAKWDRIEKIAGVLNLRSVAGLFRPRDKSENRLQSMAEGAADLLGLSQTARTIKKGLSYGASFARRASKFLPGRGALGLISSGVKGLGRAAKKGFSSVYSAVGRIAKPREESQVQSPWKTLSTGEVVRARDARGRFVGSKTPKSKKSSISNPKSTVVPNFRESPVSKANGEERSDEEMALLRRQVAALEKIAFSLKKSGTGNAGAGLGKLGGLLGGKGKAATGLLKSIWGLLKRMGGKILSKFGGLLTSALSFLKPALAAMSGPLAVAAGAAAVAYSTYKAATWIMNKLNIDPGKIGAAIADWLIPDPLKDLNKPTSGVSSATTVAKPVQKISLPDTGTGGGRGRVNPPLVVPSEDLGTSEPPTTVSNLSAVTPSPGSETYSPPDPSIVTPTAVKLPPVSAPATSNQNSEGGRGSAHMDKAGTSLSEAAGKLFKTNKSGDALDKVNPAVQHNFTAMAAEYKSQGGPGTITLNSAYRSNEEQAKLHAANPKKAAPPGKSAHGTGLALDINSREANELDKRGLLSKYGFSRPVKNEAWHLQAKGTAVALAKSGGISADSPQDQVVPKLAKVGKPSASPVVESLPQPNIPASTAQNQLAASPNTPPHMATAGAAPKGGSNSIPTFSFLDSGFFLMNNAMISA